MNGLRSTYNNFLLDGVDNNAYGTSNQGFSNQVMQPPPDAIAEFRVVTNNMSAEYGRSGGGTVNVAYKSGTNRFSGAGWEFRRDTALNAIGFFRPVAGNEPQLDRDQFGFVLGGPIVKNKAFFFTDYEGFRETQKVVSLASIPTMEQRQGILTIPVRDPRTGATYAAGTPIPMTPFARKVLSELPEPTGPGISNNYRRVRLFETDIDKYNVKLDGRVNDRLSIFGRYGYRDSFIVDEPTIPLPSGGSSNGEIYGNNKQLAVGATYTPGGTQLFEFRFGWSYTRGGKDPLSLGTPSALDAYGLPGLPTDPRVAGGLPTQAVTGFSDFGRQATNPQWQYPEVWNPKINYSVVRGRQSIKVGYEFQHVADGSAGRQPALRPRRLRGPVHASDGAAANNLYNLSDFYLGLRVGVWPQQHPGGQSAPEHALPLRAGRLPRERQAHAEPRRALRIRDAVVRARQHPDQLRSGDAHDGRRRRDGSIEDRSTIKPDRNNFGPRLGFAYSINPETVIRGGFGSSFVHFQRAGGGNVLPINGPQVINAVVSQLDPTAAVVPHDRAGLSRGPDRSDALQSARGEHHLHAARLSLQPRRQLLHLRAARVLPQHHRRHRLRRQSRGRDAAVRELQSGAAERAGREPVDSGAPADPGVRGHHVCVERRQVAV